MYYTQEQIDRANQADLVLFLQSQGEPLERAGQEYRWKRHDSLTVRGNKWYRHSQSKGGGPIDFVMEFFGKSFTEAVELLTGEKGAAPPPDRPSSAPLSDFRLPPRSPDNRTARNYLTAARRIDEDVTGFFFASGDIYEDAAHHNAVFVGRDEDGIPRYAHSKGTAGNFRLDVKGSDKAFNFCYRGEGERLFVFEAPIDLLSFLCLFKKEWQKQSYLALGGVGEKALLRFLSDRPNIKTVYLCLDSDEAGNDACSRLVKLMPEGYTVHRLIPLFKDWNEVLQHRAEITDGKYLREAVYGLKEPPQEETVEIIRMSEVDTQTVEWLWEPYIPFGKVTIDWNEQYHAEEWRHGWELVQNKYLELAGSPERVDMRSYERQGLDKIPTVHMGAAVSALERKGIETNIGNLNRDIKAANRMMNAIRSTIQNLRNWIADIVEATKEAFAETEAQAKNTSPDLVILLRDYLNLRKAERSDWSRYGQQKGTTDDLKAVSKAMIYLKEHELFTLEDLDTALQGMSEKAKGIHADMKKASVRMKVITGIQNAVADCQTHKAIHDKYLKIGWKARQAAFAESHKDELESFNKAFRYLKKQGVDLNVNLDSLQAEYDKLKATHTELAGQLAAAKEELQPMKDIRYWVSKVLTPEQSEVEKKPEPKHSVTEKMKFLQEQSNHQPEQKNPQQKKQNMEL